MHIQLVVAAILAAGIGIAHSWLGEQYLIGRLLQLPDLPHLLGSDRFTRQVVRAAWHLTTLAWWGFAAVLYVLSGSLIGVSVAIGVRLAIAMTFLASGTTMLVLTRGRHLAWIVFFAIAVLCALTAR